jgi:hypothetical protein
MVHLFDRINKLIEHIIPTSTMILELLQIILEFTVLVDPHLGRLIIEVDLGEELICHELLMLALLCYMDIFRFENV